MSSNAAPISEGPLGSFMRLTEDKKLVLRLRLSLKQKVRKEEQLQVVMEATLLQYHGQQFSLPESIVVSQETQIEQTKPGISSYF